MPLSQTAMTLALAIAGTLLFASAMQGYPAGFGKLKKIERVCILVGSLLMPLPGHSLLSFPKYEILFLSAALILPMLGMAARRKLKTSELVSA